MLRFAEQDLLDWMSKASRRPLVIRGARQTGKSTLVRQFAARHFDQLVELNFERDPDLASLFEARAPREAAALIELKKNVTILPGRTLLFLDEIQAAPELLAKLRYFHEEWPELHIIAAGSLLEFVLSEHDFSMPVGRIEYLHLGPMQFEEFLLAMGEEKLRQFLQGFSPRDSVPASIHAKLLGIHRRFLSIGGMPAVIKTYIDSGSLRECDAVLQSILGTYRDDFNKYRRRVDTNLLNKVFQRIPQLVGSRFKYSQVDREERSRRVSQALELLCLARVAHRVRHFAGNALPLDALSDDRKFKVLFLDVGLMASACGLNPATLETAADPLLVNSGALCEQSIGQHLLYSEPAYREPRLHFWLREKGSSGAEVDYVLACGEAIVPIEVKAGSAGRLRSLHRFLLEKNRSFALRFNSDAPSWLETRVPLGEGQARPFTLMSLPLYLVGQARRLCEEGIGG